MKHVIITEDDPGLQDIYRIILEKAGYRVTIYANGKQIMDNHFTHPDLFLLDRQLSGADGLDICRFLKHQESTRTIPVIIISASAGIEKMVQDSGADGFLEKPFEKKILLKIVEEATA